LTEVKIQSFARGQIIKCPLETVDLKDFFNLLTVSEKKQIYSEIQALQSDEAFNFESLVNNVQDFSIYSLNSLLEHSHGKTLNELMIKPFIQKFNIDIGAIPVHLRRKIWCPLFYSSTLLEACNDNFNFNPRRSHFGIKNYSNSVFVRSLIENLKSSDNYFSREDSEEYFSKDMLVDAISKPSELIFATSIDWLSSRLSFNLMEDKFMIRVVWFKCEKSNIKFEIDYLSVIDDQLPFYRVSTSSQSKDDKFVIFCVETTDLDILAKDLGSQLSHIGLTNESTNCECIKDISAKLEAPTRRNMHLHQATLNQIKSKFPKIDLSLCGEEYGINTFNDQILRGLLKYEEINSE
jgi:hypothetical protein